MNNLNFTQEDLNTKDAIWVVIYDSLWRILIQDHVKLDFFTIPIWKVNAWEDPDEVMIKEVLDETNLIVRDYRKLIEKDWEYDYNWITVRLRNHIYEVLLWEWNLVNKEPNKHRSMNFLSISDIKKLSKISDATKIFLSILS